ncbi:hypothetical protein JYU34_022277, partial [Plutella xylostella]
MKDQIEKLTTDLHSAHNEIQSLILENNALKNSNQEILRKYELLKKVTITPIKATPLKQKKAKTNETALNQATQTEIGHLDTYLNPTMTATYAQKCSMLSPQEPISKTNSPKNVETNTGQIKNTSKKQPKKLCLLSSNNKNDILSTTQDILTSNFKVLHYITPGGGIRELLTGLNKKIENYTLDDYCIILIGHQDFIATQDYIGLVCFVKETLQEIQHTNIVLCLPTYKCSEHKILFNWRVETFNKLLYLDLMNNNYAFMLDSNLKLQYNDSMFFPSIGTINNNGIKTILTALKELMIEIDKLNKSSSTELNDKMTQQQKTSRHEE